MKTSNQLLVALLAFALGGCASKEAAKQEAAKPSGPTTLAIHEQWVGDFPVSALNQLPESQRRNAQGFIGDAKTFAAVWSAFKPGEAVPTVDFTKNLVVFTRNTEFFNRTRIGTVKLNGGTAELMAMETMSARPIEDKMAMAMAVIPREHVRSIKTGGQLVAVPGA